MSLKLLQKMHCCSNLEAINLAPGVSTTLLTVNMDLL
jgi:hypothetical protein